MKSFILLLSGFFFFNIAIGQSSLKKVSFLSGQTQTAHRQGTFIYDLTTTTETYTDLTGTTSINNGEIWDDPEYVITLPFEFLLNETPVTSMQFFGLGSLLEAPTSEPDVYTYVFPFEADLLDRGELLGNESLSPIGYKVDGTPGNRIYKLEFKNAGSYEELFDQGTMNMFINFQMWLYEGTNMIQFRFGPSSITNPFIFYQGETGPLSGTTDYDEANELLINAHLLVGNATAPTLSASEGYLTGTPPNGTVYTLSMGQPVAVNLLVEDNTSYCEPNGSIETEVTGGVPPYTYVWSNGATTSNLQDLVAGTYSVTVTDQLGATAAASATVTTEVDPMVLEIISTDETAEDANDGTATVEVSGGLQPYSYLWSNGEITASIQDLSPGTYSVTVTDDAGCSEVAVVVINPFGCPELLLEAAVTDVSCFGSCDGSISVVEVINGVAPFSYEWSNGSTDEVASDLCAGEYALTITDNNNCIVTASWTLDEPALLTANATATPETIMGANDGTAIANPVGGTPAYSYLWSNGGVTQQITGLPPGTYSVIVTDNNNCIANDTVVVAAGPCALLTATVTDVSCYGACDGSIDLDGFWLAIQWNTGSSSDMLNGLCAGDYSVTVTDASGCIVEGTFTVNEPEELIANTGSTEETELGDDGTAWVTPQGGTPPYTYLWSNGSIDSLITGLIADMYTVTLTDANGCADTADVEVSEFICLIISENEVQHVFCHDSCDGLIFVVPLGGVGPYEYDWSTGDTANIVFDLCDGLYSVTVTDLGQNGCSAFIDVQILQPDSFYLTVDEVVHQTDTSEASIDVTFYGGTPPYIPLWLGPNGFLSFDEDISGLDPGTYVLSLFDSHDCSVSTVVEILDMTTGLTVLPEDAVSIYPNPVTTTLHIDTRLTGDYTVGMYSLLGVRSGFWENTNEIDVRELPAGMYIVRIDNAEGYYLKRIIIE